MSKLISVICTVKNGGNTISQTIESVIKQSYMNWEFVIVDDGSTDNTEHILREYARNEKRLKVHFTGGIGRGQALNKAIKLSQGEYIANIDADDVMHPQKLEIQKNIMDLNNNLFLVSTESELFYDNKKPEWRNVDKHNLETTEVGSELLIRNIISHPSVLMNKEMLVNLGCYNETRKIQVDYELWVRAFSQDMKMLRIDEKLTGKRIHENQSYENKKRFRYVFNGMLLQLNYITRSKKHILLLPIPILSFFLSLLPFKVRRKIIDSFSRLQKL